MSEQACPRCGTRVPQGRLAACPGCLLAEDSEQILIAGSIELLEELGRGGMGVVYRARQVRLDRTVAVKFLSQELASQPDFQARFDRECKALAMLRHPGIVEIHDSGSEDGLPFLVMEYVVGGSLAEAGKLAPERAIAVALQICEVLQYAHAKGVVHRDIKPGNVLMQEDGSTKVTDFGLARLTADKGWTITGSDAVAGTPLYMSPEAVAGAAPDQRMDLYSLGVVLYEMVQGQRPQGDFAALSGPLDRVVRRALAPDPGRRYQSAAEMASELRSLASAPERHDLDADQQVWVHAVAAVQALVTATFLWAFLASVTPKVLQPDEVMPLIMLGVEELDDGRILSRVRFETWWTLAAVAAAALGVAAYGLLRQHWRRELLLRSTPEQAIATSRKVLVVGAISCLVYAFRWLGSQWLPAAVMAFVPLLGAGILIAALFLSWVVVLSAVRTARPLRREVGFLLGAALAVAPAVVELVQFLLHWTVPEGS